MNKGELISAIAAKSGLSADNVREVLKGYEEVIEKALKAGDSIVSAGFGTFLVMDVAARNGCNPRTKERIAIPAKKVVKFRPGARLKINS